MTALISARARLSITPPDQEARPEGERICYHLRAPSVLDRSKLRFVMRRMGARPVAHTSVASSLRHGIRQIGADPGETAKILEVVNEWERAAEALGAVSSSVLGITSAAGLEAVRDMYDIARLETELQAASDALSEIERIVDRHYEAYRDLVSMQHYAREVEPKAAFCLFVIGADNLELPAAGDFGMPHEKLTGLVPEGHVEHVGAIAQTMLAPTRLDEKKS